MRLCWLNTQAAVLSSISVFSQERSNLFIHETFVYMSEFAEPIAADFEYLTTENLTNEDGSFKRSCLF